MLPVAIVGGGPVGLALALHLQQAGIGCAVLDARPGGALQADRRVLALSHGSRQILERVGAWRSLDATPIAAIHVSQQGRLGRTLIRARDAGVPALGYVAEAGKVGVALAQACADAGVAVLHETRVLGAESRADRALLRIAEARGETAREAQLIAWAEGAVSGMNESVRRDYRQQAIVATLQTRQPSGNVAYERFMASGPVALLPQGNRFALVWTVPGDICAGLLALDEQDFLSQLHDIFSGRFEFTEVGERSAFPLGLRFRESPVGNRAVWLGNAAQTLHPVAGQGLNLGLRDAHELVAVLRQSATLEAALRRAEWARAADRWSMIAATDFLARSFTWKLPGAATARGLGLAALQGLPPVKSWLARRMMFGSR